jgi:FkbM family methyltransferase
VNLPSRHLRAVRDPDARALRRRKAEFLELARELTPYIAAEYRGMAFLLPTSSDGKLFLKDTRWEFVALERATALLREAGRPVEGSTLVDVGAFVGTTTIPALELHGFGRAVSIEPDPDNLRLLRANLCLNGVDSRTTVVAAAASAASGSRLFLPGSRLGEALRWTKGRLTDASDPTAFRVQATTLDELVECGVVDPGSTGLLWLDCQKQELETLGSATSFIDARVPVVFALRPQRMHQKSPLLARLADAYEHVVDLRRHGKDPAGGWTAEPEPIERLPALAQRKSVTDVLLVRGLDAARTLAAAS